jgi:hypothetical protein
MSALLVHIFVIVAVGIIAILIVERFSPDATLTLIARWIVFVVVVVAIVPKLLPLLH